MSKAPWWAGVLFALLTAAKAKYPDFAATIDALMMGLMASWGAHVVQTVKNGNGNGK